MIWKNREREVGEESGGAMAFAFGRATPSLRQAPLMCLDNPVPGNIIFSLNGEHHLLLKVLHFRVDKRGINEYASFHFRLNFLGSLRKRKRVMAGKDPNGKNQMEPGAGKKITECN